MNREYLVSMNLWAYASMSLYESMNRLCIENIYESIDIYGPMNLLISMNL